MVGHRKMSPTVPPLQVLATILGAGACGGLLSRYFTPAERSEFNETSNDKPAIISRVSPQVDDLKTENVEDVSSLTRRKSANRTSWSVDLASTSALLSISSLAILFLLKVL